MAAYHSISVQDVKAKLDAGEAVTIVDVRTQSEYADGHLKGAVLIPVDTIADQAAAKLPDQAAVIITYCRSGVRSATAAHTLVNLGYTNIYDMGGLQTWPYPDEIVTN
jgi:rhodanese-related sulfurtransferase